MRSLLFISTLSLLINSPMLRADVVVDDYLGRKVQLQQPARRIIALAPHIVENLAAAGGIEYLVGAVDYCDYPEQAKSVTRVGSISQYSMEAIVGLHPDLVVVWMSTKGGAVLQRLEKLGIATYASDPHSLTDVAKSINDFGKLMATEAIAEPNAQNFLSRLANLKQTNLHKKKMSVFYQVWHDPLQTLNNKHIISDVISLCGGVNAFGDLPTLAPKLSIESVLARDPDVIIASGMGEARPDWLDKWQAWKNLRAVKNQHLYFVPPDIIQRHTLRILDGAEAMCRAIDQAR